MIEKGYPKGTKGENGCGIDPSKVHDYEQRYLLTNSFVSDAEPETVVHVVMRYIDGSFAFDWIRLSGLRMLRENLRKGKKTSSTPLFTREELEKLDIHEFLEKLDIHEFTVMTLDEAIEYVERKEESK